MPVVTRDRGNAGFQGLTALAGHSMQMPLYDCLSHAWQSSQSLTIRPMNSGTGFITNGMWPWSICSLRMVSVTRVTKNTFTILSLVISHFPGWLSISLSYLTERNLLSIQLKSSNTPKISFYIFFRTYKISFVEVPCHSLPPSSPVNPTLPRSCENGNSNNIISMIRNHQ